MKKISFPQMGDYKIPVTYLLKHIFDAEIIDPPKITSKTIQIGNSHSPEFVCTPFKYTLGTIIECIQKGANIIIQAGGGCRYGYYFELQQEILKNLGYDITYINLVTKGKTDIKKIYKEAKKIDKNINIVKSLYYVFITWMMIVFMDHIDDFIRHNIGFEKEKDSFINLKKKMLKSFSKTTGIFDLTKKYIIFKRKFKKIKIDKQKNTLKVGIIGELYTVMEPFSNYFLEKQLAEYHIEITRFTNVEYLLFKKSFKIKKYLKKTNDYIKYKMGADAADNIARTKYMCLKKYDGIIHIKSSFCTPEIGAMPIIQKIASDYGVPVIFFSFDANTSEVGIKTRIEAFIDMIERRKKDETCIYRN